MIRSMALTLVLASGWSLSQDNLDRLRWNPRERTATAVDALESGEAQAAIDALETAARLDPGNPQLRFNAGSGHLIAGSDGAIEHLEIAAETAPGSLRAAANYNLGNARFGAGDSAGAIEAFENALRSDPDNEDAKFNLELALELQQQQQEEQEQQQNEDQNDESEKENQQQDQSEGEQDEQEDPQSGQQPEQQQDQGQNQQDEQLPQFEDQPDMTAEQAAAILEAVENLEREQRRRQAQEEMKKRPRKGKDW